MTGADVHKLREGAQLSLESCTGHHYRGKIDTVTDNLIRVEWFGHGYDVIRKTSPIWYSIVERK